MRYFRATQGLKEACLGSFPKCLLKYHPIKSPEYEVAWPRSLLKSTVNLWLGIAVFDLAHSPSFGIGFGIAFGILG